MSNIAKEKPHIRRFDAESSVPPYIEKLLRMDFTSISYNYEYSPTQITEITEMSKMVAQTLSAIHGLQPLNRKKWIKNKYTGMGMFSVMDTVMKTIQEGKWVLMEQRRKRVNPERPKVALLMDISGSMTHRRIKSPACVLASSLIQLMGGGFATEFDIVTIGDGGTWIKSEFYQAINPDHAIKWLLEKKFDNWDNTFLPAFQTLEENNFFGGNEPKFLFVITDGVSEINHDIREGPYVGMSSDDATRYDNEHLGEFVYSHWNMRPNVAYFWIHISEDNTPDLSDLEREVKFVAEELGYVPPIQEIGETLFNKYRGREHHAWRDDVGCYDVGKFFWTSFRQRSFIYVSIADLKNGKAFTKVMEYIKEKFAEQFK